MSDDYISIDDVASEEGKTKATIWRWVRQHGIQTYRFSNSRRAFIRREDMAKFHEPIRAEPTPPTEDTP